MTLLEKPIGEREVADWRQIAAFRFERLNRLIDLAEGEQPGAFPRFLVSREIDLLRTALDALDRLAGDRECADAVEARP